MASAGGCRRLRVFRSRDAADLDGEHDQTYGTIPLPTTYMPGQSSFSRKIACPSELAQPGRGHQPLEAWRRNGGEQAAIAQIIDDVGHLLRSEAQCPKNPSVTNSSSGHFTSIFFPCSLSSFSRCSAVRTSEMWLPRRFPGFASSFIHSISASGDVSRVYLRGIAGCSANSFYIHGHRRRADFLALFLRNTQLRNDLRVVSRQRGLSSGVWICLSRSIWPGVSIARVFVDNSLALRSISSQTG